MLDQEGYALNLLLTLKENPVMTFSDNEDTPPTPEEIPADKLVLPEQAEVEMKKVETMRKVYLTSAKGSLIRNIMFKTIEYNHLEEAPKEGEPLRNSLVDTTKQAVEIIVSSAHLLVKYQNF
jgi:hypothetical protein